MRVQSPAAHGATSRVGTVLGAIAIGFLVALAPVMAVAHRSSPLMLTLAALFALAAVLADGRARELGRALAEALSSPLGVASLAFLAWGAASCAWSAAGRLAPLAFGEFALSLAAGLIVAMALPPRMTRSVTLAFAGATMLAAILVLADLGTGLATRQMLGMRANPFVLNRPALTLLVLLPVGLWLLVRDRRPWLALLFGLLIAAAILRSESGAAKLGLGALVAMGGLTLAWRRLGVVLVGAGLLAALALAPVAGEIASRVLPEPVYGVLARAHAQDRVDIWRSFGAALRDRPILGAGFDASARLGTAPVAGRIAPDQAAWLFVGHPHDAALQIWVELGAVGAWLAALIVLLLLRATAGLDRAECAVMVALVAAGLAVSLVGQGAWQGWWPAGIGASLAWFRYGRRTIKG